MRKLTYVLIRYSVLIENTKSWIIANNDIDKYKSQLFEPIRLHKHLELFKNITLPSLKNQTKTPDESWLRVVIITSQDLPQWNKTELEHLAEQHNWLDIDYLPTRGVALERMLFEDLKKDNQDTLVATVRLDDDDALATDFFEKLDEYTTVENVGKSLSFGKGFAGFYDFTKNNYRKVVDYYYPKIAAGLTYFNFYNAKESRFTLDNIKTIFNTGGHTRIDQNVPTILDSRDPMFIRTMHDHSDSANTNKRELLLMNLKSVEPKVVLTKFPFLDSSHVNQRVDFENGNNQYCIQKHNDLNFYTYNLEASAHSNLIVSFNAAIAKRSHKVAPFFSARAIAKTTNLGLLSFSDPVVDVNTDLTLGWYLGDLDFIGLNSTIHTIILHIIRESGKRPLLFGCSGGGFSAMVQSMYLSSVSIPHDIIVCNPQTNIFEYHSAAVDRFFGKVKKDYVLDSHEDRLKYLSDVGSKYEVKLSDLKSDYARIFYLQNINDDFHIENHLMPFLEEMSLDTDFKNLQDDSFNLIFEDFGPDHAAPSRDYFTNFISTHLINSKKEIINNTTIDFINKISKDKYSIELSLYPNSIEVNVDTFDKQFELTIHLIIDNKFSGQSLIINQESLKGVFSYDWRGRSVSISVFQLDSERKCSKNFKIL